MTDLAIVIVNWNVKDMLAACLRSVEADLASSSLSGSVWVVDNASSDDSVAMLKQDFPNIHLIASEINLGFAKGNNAALRAIGFDTASSKNTDLPKAVLLLNPDTEVHPGALQTLFDYLKQHPKVGVVGPKLIFGDGSFQHSAFDFPGLWQLIIELLPVPGRFVESRLNGRYALTLYDQGQPFQIGHPLGAAMCVKREAIEQVGLLDEKYHMYVEEVDWGKRIVQAGWQAYCLPQATITHFGGQSTEQIKLNSFINLWTSRYQFYKKHYNSLKVWLAGKIVSFGMHRKMKADQVAAEHQQLSRDVLTERLACYQQVIDIWQGKPS